MKPSYSKDCEFKHQALLCSAIWFSNYFISKGLFILQTNTCLPFLLRCYGFNSNYHYSLAPLRRSANLVKSVAHKKKHNILFNLSLFVFLSHGNVVSINFIKLGRTSEGGWAALSVLILSGFVFNFVSVDVNFGLGNI